MLTAGLVISISCIIFKIKLVPGILITLSTMLFFYIIGLLITKLIDKINLDAENKAIELTEAEEMKDENPDEIEASETGEVGQEEFESTPEN